MPCCSKMLAMTMRREQRSKPPLSAEYPALDLISERFGPRRDSRAASRRHRGAAMGSLKELVTAQSSAVNGLTDILRSAQEQIARNSEAITTQSSWLIAMQTKLHAAESVIHALVDSHPDPESLAQALASKHGLSLTAKGVTRAGIESADDPAAMDENSERDAEAMRYWSTIIQAAVARRSMK